jgi:voltage-gated potassium channel Kch
MSEHHDPSAQHGCRADCRQRRDSSAVHVGGFADLPADRSAETRGNGSTSRHHDGDMDPVPPHSDRSRCHAVGDVLYASGALPSFEEALYFSTVTFTTVGYGDIILGREWRQLATFEAANGWIIFGWATALIMTVIQRLYFPFEAGRRRCPARPRLRHRQYRPAPALSPAPRRQRCHDVATLLGTRAE